LVSGGLEVNGSAAFDGFVLFGNNASVSGVLDITKAISSAQLKIRQSATVNAGFYVDSVGDLTLSTTGENIRMNDQNLWVCIGACGTTPPAENGNIILETGIIFDNNFRFKKTGATTIDMLDSGDNLILQFDEGQ